MDKPASERRQLGIRKLPNGETEGLDPRKIDRSLLEEIGHTQTPVLSVLKSHCLDCAHTASEVRRCTSALCALWPYRMGTNPFRPERSDAQKAADRLAGERLKAANPHNRT